MAAKEDEGAGGDSAELLPETPGNQTSTIEQNLPPDTEENVSRQAEDIVRNFIYERYIHDLIDAGNTGDTEGYGEQTPAMPELTNFTSDPLGSASRVGRQLAMIGDDINSRYADQFSGMVKMLDLTPNTAYDAFAGIARRLFEDGVINWGRVITLLCFGYRMARQVLISGMKTFFRKIVEFLVKFIVREKIAKWIAEQGGWVAALRYVPESVGWPTIAMISVFAALSITMAYWISKR
ncbi:bcl-2 homologous antagonist/killer-like [Tubulanus polymorphus]|uniref:bcl-2 homologous antagonist/killer-like n=1 Tax=Tubulanus polymorphus TaxID=672921 RepID=UPI003DA4F21C